jgi:hypothetical protein
MPARLRHGIDRFRSNQQPEDSSRTPSPPSQPAPARRTTLFQRLHLSSHSRKKPKPPKLHIERPTTSSSLPVVRSSSQTRAVSSHSTDAATIAEITSMMPQSLDLGTQTDRKRQRSRDSRKTVTGSDGGGRKASTDSQRLARQGIRMPAYLSKTKSGTSGLSSGSVLLTTPRNHDRFPRPRMEATHKTCRCSLQSKLSLQG